MLRLTVLCASLLLSTTACAEAETQKAPATPDQPTASTEPTVELSADDPRAWYVGHAWVLEGESCDSGDSAIIDPGGRFESQNYGGGTWTLDGDRITFDSDTDEPRTWTLRQVEDGVAELRHEDGRVFRERRCPPVG